MWGLSILMISSLHNNFHLLETEEKSPEVGVCLPMWRGNWKQAHTQSSHPIRVILGVFSPGTKTNKQTNIIALVNLILIVTLPQSLFYATKCMDWKTLNLIILHFSLPRLSSDARSWTIEISCVSQERPFRKPCWASVNIWLVSKCSVIAERTMCSRSLQHMHVSEIGL